MHALLSFIIRYSKNFTYRCRFIHRDLSCLTLFLFTFSICDGHSKFLFKSIKAFNRSFFVVCLEQVCLYSAWRKKLTRSWPVQLETAISSFSRFRFLSTLIVKLVPFSRSGLPFEIFFSRSPVITIRSKFLTSRSAVQDNPFEILLLPFSRLGLPFGDFFSRSDVLPSVRNFSLAVQPSYQSVRNKLSAVQPFGFIRFKRLRGPFLTRSTAVRFTRLTESR